MSKDSIDLHIGSRLRTLRDEKGMTLQETGQAVELTYQQIRKYELGENRVSASTLYRLSEFFGVEPAFFFHGLPRRDGAADKADLIDHGDALSRIGDAEIRHYITGLIRVLGSRSPA